ncbi:MAG: tyrosine-protein phosphatase [Candidatus Acidiferrum sp.]
MKRLLLLFSLVLASVLPASLCAQTQTPAPAISAAHFIYGEKLRISGVPNSGKIDDHLYRGAQPRSAGLLALKKLGITTIVDLRDEDSTRIVWEEKRSESLGIRFVQIPVGGWSPPTDKQVAQFLAIFRDHPQEKVFVHCHYGEDRTGVFVASYRMAYEKVPPDDALREMYYFGFNGFWHPSMAAFVSEFPERLATAPPLVPFKNKE